MRYKCVVYVACAIDPIIESEKLTVNDTPQLLQAGLAIISALLYVGTSARQLLFLDREGCAPREASVIYLAVGPSQLMPHSAGSNSQMAH